jgi:hypothetical protein
LESTLPAAELAPRVELPARRLISGRLISVARLPMALKEFLAPDHGDEG